MRLPGESQTRSCAGGGVAGGRGVNSPLPSTAFTREQPIDTNSRLLAILLARFKHYPLGMKLYLFHMEHFLCHAQAACAYLKT